ncbi:MAG: hypothetical protein ACR2RF_24675 [Geminicoccaceae bacterium]
MAWFGAIAGKHHLTLSSIGRWLLAFICSVLGASFISSVIFAASGSDSDVLPFDQLLLAAWIFTGCYTAIYGIIPAVLLTYLCERYSLHDKSPLIFMAAGVLVGTGIAATSDYPKSSGFDIFVFYAPFTGAVGGLVFALLRRKLSTADPERGRSTSEP